MKKQNLKVGRNQKLRHDIGEYNHRLKYEHNAVTSTVTRIIIVVTKVRSETEQGVTQCIRLRIMGTNRYVQF